MVRPLAVRRGLGGSPYRPTRQMGGARPQTTRGHSRGHAQVQLFGGSRNPVCMGKRRFFEIYIQMNLSEKYPGARERFLTGRSVKRGRWVYDRGERALIRNLESEPPSNRGACEYGSWWVWSPPTGCRAPYLA